MSCRTTVMRHRRFVDDDGRVLLFEESIPAGGDWKRSQFRFVGRHEQPVGQAESSTANIYCKSIVERICGKPTLAICDLRREGVELLIKACELLDMPEDWIAGDKPLHPDIVESLGLLLTDVAAAVEAELSDPTKPLRAVSGGGS